MTKIEIGKKYWNTRDENIILVDGFDPIDNTKVLYRLKSNFDAEKYFVYHIEDIENLISLDDDIPLSGYIIINKNSGYNNIVTFTKNLQNYFKREGSRGNVLAIIPIDLTYKLEQGYELIKPETLDEENSENNLG